MIGASATALFVGIISGIGQGSVYALVALSFTMIVAATGLFHFGLGSVVMVGTVGSYVLGVSLGWSMPFVIAGLMFGGAVIGFLSDRIAVRPIRGRTKNEQVAVLISTLALSLVITAIVTILFGLDERRVPTYIDGPPWTVGEVPVRRIFVVMTATVALVSIGLEILLRRTELGRVLRAAEEDPTGTQLLGVRISRVTTGVFAFAGAIAALAGFLVAPISFASPFVGADLLLYGFGAMAIGGFGSFYGALVGGLVVGVIRGVTPVYFDSTATRPLIFASLLVVLTLRPQGLFGHGVAREA